MKTFEEAYNMFRLPGGFAEADSYTNALFMRYKDLIHEVVHAQFIHDDIRRVILALVDKEAQADRNEAPGAEELTSMFQTIAMTCLVRGLMIGVEMEKGDPLNKVDTQPPFKPQDYEASGRVTHQIVSRREGDQWTLTLYERYFNPDSQEDCAHRLMQWTGPELFLGLSEVSRAIHAAVTGLGLRPQGGMYDR